MHTLLVIFAVIGVIAVAFSAFAVVMFVRQMNERGWTN